MKKVLFILLCCLVIFTIGGCGKEKLEIGNVSDKVIKDNDILLTVQKDSISKIGATFIITNNTDKNIIYGDDYELEIKKDNEWHVFNVRINFMTIGYILNAHDSKEIDINWENNYVNLDSGEYRLIKLISFEEGEKDSFYIASEFEIK